MWKAHMYPTRSLASLIPQVLWHEYPVLLLTPQTKHEQKNTYQESEERPRLLG